MSTFPAPFLNVLTDKRIREYFARFQEAEVAHGELISEYRHLRQKLFDVAREIQQSGDTGLQLRISQILVGTREVS